MHRQCGEIISEGTDPEWKSPTVRCRRTRRHSAWCTGYERCSPAPSTSEEETSADKHSLFSLHQRLCVWLNVLILLCFITVVETVETAGCTYAAFGDVVVVMHDVSGQSKVTDLGQFALTDQDVSCSQIPMHTLTDRQTERCFIY